MFEKQNNLCAICGEVEVRNKILSLDHCHKTNKVRGIICNKCNMAIGQFNEEIKNLKNAIKYLKKYE